LAPVAVKLTIAPALRPRMRLCKQQPCGIYMSADWHSTLQH
jgi:hypothetical protein